MYTLSLNSHILTNLMIWTPLTLKWHCHVKGAEVEWSYCTIYNKTIFLHSSLLLFTLYYTRNHVYKITYNGQFSKEFLFSNSLKSITHTEINLFEIKLHVNSWRSQMNNDKNRACKNLMHHGFYENFCFKNNLLYRITFSYSNDFSYLSAFQNEKYIGSKIIVALL